MKVAPARITKWNIAYKAFFFGTSTDFWGVAGVTLFLCFTSKKEQRTKRGRDCPNPMPIMKKVAKKWKISELEIGMARAPKRIFA